VDKVQVPVVETKETMATTQNPELKLESVESEQFNNPAPGEIAVEQTTIKTPSWETDQDAITTQNAALEQELMEADRLLSEGLRVAEEPAAIPPGQVELTDTGKAPDVAQDQMDNDQSLNPVEETAEDEQERQSFIEPDASTEPEVLDAAEIHPAEPDELDIDITENVELPKFRSSRKSEDPQSS
jgi:hypothetical protein